MSLYILIYHHLLADLDLVLEHERHQLHALVLAEELEAVVADARKYPFYGLLGGRPHERDGLQRLYLGAHVPVRLDELVLQPARVVFLRFSYKTKGVRAAAAATVC